LGRVIDKRFNVFSQQVRGVRRHIVVIEDSGSVVKGAPIGLTRTSWATAADRDGGALSEICNLPSAIKRSVARGGGWLQGSVRRQPIIGK
jgi:hypothetical protein